MASPNYFFSVLQSSFPLLPISLILWLNFIFALAHDNSIDSSHSQQSLFQQVASSQKTNTEDKVELLHPVNNGNNSDLNTRFYAGEFNKNYGSGDYYSHGSPNHNYYPQSNPVFVPSYGSYATAGASSYGQRPPGIFPYPHFPHHHHGHKIPTLISPQIRLPLLEHFSNSLIPPKHHFPFNPSPPIDPSLDYYPNQQYPNPGREPYPSYPGFVGGQNYASAFHLGLPKQVKVPGRIEISVTGNDAEITCEFPRYLILMQKIYWHHKYDDPYGSYYDENNGFGPRIRVVSSDQWRSVLQIRDFTEDDYGPYRCISAAVLPDEGSLTSNRNLFLNDKQVSTTEATVDSPVAYTDHPYPFDSEGNSKKNQKSSKQKSRQFQNSRKIRFIRDTKMKSPQEGTKATSEKRERSSESHLIASPEIYDPFSRTPGGPYDHTEAFPYIKPFPNPNRNYIPPAHVTPNYYPTSGAPTKLPFSLPHHHHNHNRYNYNYNQVSPYHYGIGKYPNINYGLSSSYGLNAPYYKPKYSIFTIYQEINFAPLEYKPTVNPVGK